MHSASINGPQPISASTALGAFTALPIRNPGKDSQFILDLEPLDQFIKPQVIAMLATASVYLKDMVRIALDCYIDSNGMRGLDFNTHFGTKMAGCYMSLTSSRQRQSQQYTDAELLPHFHSIVQWIYEILYEHIAHALGNVQPNAIIVINNYISLDDAVQINLSIDYLPF